MKKTMLILLAFKVLIFGKCLDERERYRLNQKYLDTNIINCELQKKTNFEEAICSNKDLTDMFAYYTISSREFWAGQGLSSLGGNGTIKDFNEKLEKSEKEELKKLNKNYSEKNINLDNVCFDLKRNTTIYTHIFSIYNMASRDDEDYLYYVQENKYGAVITDREGEKIYLGNYCDVLDDKKQKGYWYKYKEDIDDEDYIYVIKLKDKDIKLFAEQKLELDKIECTEYKVKELMQK